jgi:hypothetical protein
MGGDYLSMEAWREKESDFSNSLTLWGEINSLSSSNFNTWEDHIEYLLDRTINQCPYDNGIEVNIEDIYWRNFKYFRGLPDFGDIMQDINDYNDEIIYKMAEIQYENDPSYNDMPREEGIDEIHRMLYEFNDYDYFSRLDSYVYKYLADKGFFFLLPNSYYTYEKLFDETDVMIAVNDSQNIIFEGFLNDIQESVYEYYPNSLKNVTIWSDINE